MRKRSNKVNKRAKVGKKAHQFVVVTARSYGKALKGVKIHFEGPKPPSLRNDGTIQLGKHLLETFTAKYPKFQWIITPSADSVTTSYGIVRVRTSRALLRKMGAETWDRSRDIKNEIVRRFLSLTFPAEFPETTHAVYTPGAIAKLVQPGIVPKLSGEDKEALNNFLPDYLATEASGSVNELKAAAEIKTLKGLATDLGREIGKAHPESWWQGYIKSNILIIQQGYIKAIDKMNIALGTQKLPDFCLVTHDSYLDILEIKKPDTNLLKEDAGRGNFYWDNELSKAIIQTENYIEQISNKAADIRTYLLDTQKIDVKAVRPRGIILAGNAQQLASQKQKDDFHLLSQGVKSLTVVTYDELLARLQNYIGVLETYSRVNPRAKRKKKAA